MTTKTNSDTELADTLDLLDGFSLLPGIEDILTGIQKAAAAAEVGDLDPDATQTLLAALAGADEANVLTALAYLIGQLSDADTNPTLRTLPIDQQEQARKHGSAARYELLDPYLHQHASEASAAIDGN
ncbi:hypothetical protein AB0L71_28130 [Streptomyces sp. NPDC052052]|uniref:hypothetical protein n=1 Tax=Streptomyces sp. NPDC052052 TaxID=3154756 RepID=UPI00341B1C74